MKPGRIVLFIVLVMMLSGLFCTSASAENTTAIKNDRDGVVYIEYYYGNESWSGTGFFIGKKGQPVQYIITNRHVVSYHTYDGDYRVNGEAYVFFSKNDYEEAEIIYWSPTEDFAVLKISSPTNKRKALPLISTEGVDTTDIVYALGFPGNANIINEDVKFTSDDVTVTKGIVTKKEVIFDNDQYLQMDVAINSGNSGGPLVDEKGFVIGINTLSALNTEGTHCALYIDYVMDYLQDEGIEFYTIKNVKAGSLSNLLKNVLLIMLFASVIGGVVYLLINKKIPLLAGTQIKIYFDIEHIIYYLFIIYAISCIVALLART